MPDLNFGVEFEPQVADRSDAEGRVAFDEVDKGWKMIESWLPAEGEVSEVDGKTLVSEQWDTTKAAYSGLGHTPKLNPGEAERFEFTVPLGITGNQLAFDVYKVGEHVYGNVTLSNANGSKLNGSTLPAIGVTYLFTDADAQYFPEGVKTVMRYVTADSPVTLAIIIPVFSGNPRYTGAFISGFAGGAPPTPLRFSGQLNFTNEDIYSITGTCCWKALG